VSGFVTVLMVFSITQSEKLQLKGQKTAPSAAKNK
jgi:hypothetical protein